MERKLHPNLRPGKGLQVTVRSLGTTTRNLRLLLWNQQSRKDYPSDNGRPRNQRKRSKLLKMMLSHQRTVLRTLILSWMLMHSKRLAPTFIELSLDLPSSRMMTSIAIIMVITLYKSQRKKIQHWTSSSQSCQTKSQ